MGDYNYYFDSTGGCAKCDALSGNYSNPPRRPHPHCDCQIEKEKSFTCYEVNISVDNVELNLSGNKDQLIGLFEFSAEINCFNGENKVEPIDATGIVEIDWDDQHLTDDEIKDKYKDDVLCDALSDAWSKAELAGIDFCNC